LKAACERLLHPSVETGEERARQARLLGILLAAPMLAALATAEIAARQMGLTSALSAAALVFGVGLLPPLVLITTAKRRIAEALALSLGAVTLGALIARSGGAISPLVVMSAGFVVEAAWLGRTRRAIVFGSSAAAVAIGLGVALTALSGTDLPSAWQWLVPLVYAATLLVRWPFTGPAEGQVSSETPGLALEEMIGAAVLRLQVSGDVVHASPKLEEVLGVAPEMLLGTGFFDRIHVTDRVAWLSTLGDLREGAGPRTLRLRLRVPAAPGLPIQAAYRSFIFDVAALQDAAGVVALLREDVSTAAAEEALAEARHVAEAACRSRDEMLASVSHELRTPLNAIVGFADLLANEMFGKFANDKQREYVEVIREAGTHLLSVVNAILDVSKVQSGAYGVEAKPFHFEDAVRLCMAMTTHQAQAKSVELKADIAGDIGTVRCDKNAVQQVLINLLSNAVKFTPSGEVKVTAHRSGDRLEFTVSDTGIGISAEDLELVGTPFMQVRNDYTRKCEGTGLGLALVKGLVRLQGGGLSIESAPGRGTRVHVSLPAGPADACREVEDSSFAASGANYNREWYDDALRKTA
jgi:cell cycle sensor histidine kinase DivJ